MPVRVGVVFLILLSGVGMVARADRREVAPARASFESFPMRIGEWQGTRQPPFSDEVLRVLGVDDYMVRIYSGDGVGAGLYVGYWASQRQGDTMHSPLNCLPGAGWEPEEQDVISIPDPRNASAPQLPLNRYVIHKGMDRLLVLYWYQSRGRIVASEYAGKIYLVTDAVRLNRTDGAIVRVTVPIDARTPDAEARAEAAGLHFVNALLPQLDRFIPN